LSTSKPLTVKLIEPVTPSSIIVSGLRAKRHAGTAPMNPACSTVNAVEPGYAPAVYSTVTEVVAESWRSEITRTSVSERIADGRSSASEAVGSSPAASSSLESIATPGIAKASAARPAARRSR
jgi:hypothetical protein